MNEKLYAVKNDKGEWLSFDSSHESVWYTNNPTFFNDKSYVKAQSMGYKGHVVTFVEEPEKVKLPDKAAGWVATVKSMGRDITDIFDEVTMPEEVCDWLYDDDEVEHREERGLMLVNAYQYGYTVAKEKKYNIKVPKKWSGDDKHYWTKEQDGALTWACLINKDYMISAQQFTAEEIKKCHLDGLEKVEVEENGGLDK